MKKIMFTMMIAFMAIQGLNAAINDVENQLELYCSNELPWWKPIKRSALTMMQVFLSESYIRLYPSEADSGYTYVIITDASGTVVKSHTVVLVPERDTLLYIGDLASGTYELTIKTDSYTLHGSFEVE